MISFVLWKWTPPANYRSKFGPETVNVMKRMIDRHYHAPHRVICVTDDAKGIDPEVEILPLWNDYADLQSPHGRGNPACYRRLRMFAPDAGKYFGERFVSMDLDCVIVADITKLFDRPEGIVLYGDTNPTTPYNGSLILLKAGARPEVWEDFHPERSPKLARERNYFGSDQAWIGYRLGPHEAKWTRRDGVYSYRNEIGPQREDLPIDAKMIVMHGQTDPWMEPAKSREWVQKHYR